MPMFLCLCAVAVAGNADVRDTPAEVVEKVTHKIMASGIAFNRWSYGCGIVLDSIMEVNKAVCRVTRRWSFCITDQYDVQLSGPMAHHPPVMCQGRWPNQFTLGGPGGVFATVDKKMFAWADTYHVQVAAGQDVLLFLAISCAIDRIHHEVEDARARRENNSY